LYFHVNITIFNDNFLGVGAGKGRPEEMWAEMFMLLDEDHNMLIYKTCYLANNYFNNKNKTIAAVVIRPRDQSQHFNMYQ
jgi:hypothetical protein